MYRFETEDLTALNLKMMGRRSRTAVLISAGRPQDKERLLPAIERLAQLSTTIYATRGTSAFLRAREVTNTEVFKVSETREPNIRSLLAEQRFDLVVNILTGDPDYDEASDSKLIRCLSVDQGIPLITDVEVALLTIGRMLRNWEERQTYAQPNGREAWNLHRHFLELVEASGGYACHHAHFDKAYLISMDNLRLGQVDMQRKWALYKYLKENYTHEDLVERISRGVEMMIRQGATYCRTLLDADSTVRLGPVKAACEVRERYKGQIRFEFGTQPLQGVLEPESRRFFEQACEIADVVGGLPSRDRPTPEKHLDCIMDIAKSFGKPLDVHVDQENNPLENETELLALKTIEHGLEGRVSAIHAVSLAAKPPTEQDRIIRIVKDAGLNVIVCPSAALSMKPLEMNAPLHNSIAPVNKLLDAGVPVYLGVDNVYDLFMPITDGDMWFECRLLMEACRFYDVERVAALAAGKGA